MILSRISTFEQVWEDNYGMDKSTASFNYFALMAGFIIGLQLSHHFIDGVCSTPQLSASPCALGCALGSDA